MNRKVNLIFYLGLATSVLLFLLPPEYKMGVYSPNYLGWFWLLVCLPVTLITFIWSGISDIMTKSWRALTIRIVIFIAVFFISVTYWFYMAYEAGNLS
jgi:hypothetical protein